MLTPAQVADFKQTGFLDGDRILDDDEVDELRADLDRIIEKGTDGFAPGESRPARIQYSDTGTASESLQIVNIWMASQPYERLLYTPYIVEGMSQLTGQPDLMVWHDQIQYKPPNSGGGLHWHQDAPAWRILRPSTPVSVWIALDDADEENGCMWMVPGSHNWGIQSEFLRAQGHLNERDDLKNIKGFTPPSGAKIKSVTPCSRPVKKGAVSFHHSLTWHSSPPNHSDRHRRAIAIHYMTGEARFVGEGGHVMKQFVNLEDGAPMSEAGDSFPHVCRNGEPIALPSRLQAI